jgi:formate-dependent nitrite reductase membrane component NrfD
MDQPESSHDAAEGRSIADGKHGEVVGATQPATPADTPGTGSYYGLPVLKAPLWRWEVWLYFFSGGLAAGSFIVASMATLFGGEEDRTIARAGYLVSLVSVALCPPLLIRDLGRPRRFLNMLRVVKPESPMSLGVWALCLFSACSGALGLQSLLATDVGVLGRISRRAPVRPLAAFGTILACFFGSYTGVLLSATSVPVWSRSRLLAPTFLASAVSTGAAAIRLILALGGSGTTHEPDGLRRMETVAIVAEAAALASYLIEARSAARPLVDPRKLGQIFVGGAVGLGIIAPLTLALVRRDTRRARVLAALSALVGGLGLRYAVVMAGHLSAADGEAYLRISD